MALIGQVCQRDNDVELSHWLFSMAHKSDTVRKSRINNKWLTLSQIHFYLILDIKIEMCALNILLSKIIEKLGNLKKNKHRCPINVFFSAKTVLMLQELSLGQGGWFWQLSLKPRPIVLMLLQRWWESLSVQERIGCCGFSIKVPNYSDIWNITLQTYRKWRLSFKTLLNRK